MKKFLPTLSRIHYILGSVFILSLFTIKAEQTRSSILQTDFIPILEAEDNKIQLQNALEEIDETRLLLNNNAIPSASTLDSSIATLFTFSPCSTDCANYDPTAPISDCVSNGLIPYLQSALAKINLFDTIKQVACGENHAVILTENGSVYAVGDNTYGQLGIGETGGTHTTFIPMIGEGTSGVTAIAAGYRHTVVLKGDAVYATGDNAEGQLGTTEGNKDELTPMLSPGDTGVTAIAAGDFHTVVLKGDVAYATGDNSYGQLGTTEGDKSVLTPLLAPGNEGITAIAAGNNHTVVIKNSAAYATGDNTYGQLGIGLTPTMTSVLTPMASPGDADITDIAAGQDFTIVLKNSAAYGTGRNTSSQLGTAQPDNKNVLTVMASPGDTGVTAIAAGDFHTVVLKDTVAYAVGANNRGQLGTTTGGKTVLTELQSPGDADVTAINAGANFTFALKNGAVYATGENTVGQLGTTAGDKEVLTEILGAVRGIYNFNQA